MSQPGAHLLRPHKFDNPDTSGNAHKEHGPRPRRGCRHCRNPAARRGAKRAADHQSEFREQSCGPSEMIAQARPSQYLAWLNEVDDVCMTAADRLTRFALKATGFGSPTGANSLRKSG